MADKIKPLLLNPRIVLHRLYRLGNRGFGRFQAEHRNHRGWAVGLFWFRHTTDAGSADWEVWIKHPDGDDLCISRGCWSYSPGQAEPYSGFTMPGMWDAALQRALRQINDACECEEDQRSRKEAEDKAARDAAAAKQKVKFEALFQDNEEPNDA